MMPVIEADLDRLQDYDRLLAGLVMEARALRLALDLRAFAVDQPRVPAGTPAGGQWTHGGSQDGDARIEPVDFKPVPKYHVNLEEEERRGGHTLRRHVGKSDERLLLETGQEYLRPLVEIGQAPAQGCFDSRESANDFVNRVLERSKVDVDSVANGAEDEATLEVQFGFVTGREAIWTDPKGGPYMRKTYSVRAIIVHDPRLAEGYRVKTAFPMNKRPSR